MANLLHDPKIFNYLCMLIYSGATIRWAFAGSWFDALYWFASVIITIAITYK